jgi:predicted NBD/HSP70 family sugar kinase
MAFDAILTPPMDSLGIDVGGSSVKLALVRDGKTLWQTQTETYARPTSEQLASSIRTAIAAKASEAKFDPQGAAGICVPGTRDLVKRSVIQSVNLPALNGLVLDDLIVEAIGHCPGHVEIMTDANATGYDVYVTNRMAGRLCSIAIGTGIGAAVLDDGKPLMVDGESPGHIGQMDVSIAGVPVIGPDGGAGSLEGYLGSPAIVARYGPDMPKNLANFGPTDPPIQALVRTIRICHAMYCPHHIALTGGIGIRMGHLLTMIQEQTNKDLTRIARKGWTLICGTDEFHAAKGAAKYAAAKSSSTKSARA